MTPERLDDGDRRARRVAPSQSLPLRHASPEGRAPKARLSLIGLLTIGATYLLRDEEGLPIHLIAQIESLEARRQAEGRLAEERERLRITLQSIDDAVITTDAQTHITYINAAAESLLGLAMNRDMADEKSWLDAADKACYIAKRDGRGLLRIATPTPGDELHTA